MPVVFGDAEGAGAARIIGLELRAIAEGAGGHRTAEELAIKELDVLVPRGKPWEWATELEVTVHTTRGDVTLRGALP